MIPYYEDDLVRLFHGDCRKVTAWLEADVLVTDPPYGIPGGRVGTHDGIDRFGDAAWDSLEVRDEVLALWGERPYAVFGGAGQQEHAPAHRGVPLIWDKEWIGMGDTTFPWGRGYELVYVNGAGWHGRREQPIFRLHHNPLYAQRDGHPTAKPTQLLERIIAKAPLGAVADPFAGSGSTLVAAKQLGRKAIGVEIEERYCEIAARRLAQDTLFGSAS